MNYIVVIPARYKSTRLPGKPLIKLKGTPMIIRTYRQCLKAVSSNKIYVATDSNLIKKTCDREGIQVVMTSPSCLTGTDRVAEVAKKIKTKYYINVQGDEPLFNPKDLKKLLKFTKRKTNDVLLGYCKLTNLKQFFNKNVPKLVFDKNKYLIYSSRSPIPNQNKVNMSQTFKGVWAYLFPREKLLRFGHEKKKTFLEQIEDIEILRFIELGIKVKLVKMSEHSHPVDIMSDIKKVVKKIKNTN